jgi:glycosyltransferase involved in cell wall biosynthesis
MLDSFQRIKRNIIDNLGTGQNESLASLLPFLYKTQKLTLLELLALTVHLNDQQMDNLCSTTIISDNKSALETVKIIRKVSELRKNHETVDPINASAYPIYREAQILKRKFTNLWDIHNKYTRNLEVEAPPSDLPSEKIKVCVVSTTDTQGGAAIAAYRLHKSLNENSEVSCRMLVLEKQTNDVMVEEIIQNPTQHTQHSSIEEVLSIQNIATLTDKEFTETILWHCLYWLREITDRIIYSNFKLRTDTSNTLFSAIDTGFDIAKHQTVIEADIINIHWSSFFLASYSINKILELGKPVFFTLHDMRHFTGGCHYSAGCTEFQSSCFPCPQISTEIGKLIVRDQFDELQHVFRNHKNIYLTTPSNWLSELAASSTLFRGIKKYSIPNSLSPVFNEKNISRAKLRFLLNIPPNHVTFLFIANGLDERRKGAAVFVQALLEIAEELKDSPSKPIGITTIATVVTLGNEHHVFDGLSSAQFNLINMGHIRDEHKIAEIYSAADFLVLPTLEDNYPNVIIESLAMGTPVITYNSGGCGEIINETNETGYLVNHQDIVSLKDIINRTIAKEISFSPLRCKEYVKNNNKASDQANRFLSAFKDSLTSRTNIYPHAPIARQEEGLMFRCMSTQLHEEKDYTKYLGLRLNTEETIYLNQGWAFRRLRLSDNKAIRLRITAGEFNKNSSLFLKSTLAESCSYFISITLPNHESIKISAAEALEPYETKLPLTSDANNEIILKINNELGYGKIGDVIIDLGIFSA